MSTEKKTTSDLVPISDIINDVLKWLGTLDAEAIDAAEQHGPLRGLVRPAQQRWSETLDRIEHTRQGLGT